MDVKLVMFKSNGQRKDLPLAGDVTVIGRGEKCDLRVPILSVSRRHCELRIAEEGLVVKDLASSNGTYVNNKRVNEASLGAGDRLVIGPIVFTVQVDGVPEEIRPVKTKGQLMAEAGRFGAEAVVRAEAEVVAQPGASTADELAAAAKAGEKAEVDPISALEALAGESEEDQEQQKE
ncbi:MAG: FHA domain-containing protein [Phycisphaerae bacterium]|nr:FHA domain-containing protein [Phycisphaerae bacterium]